MNNTLDQFVKLVEESLSIMQEEFNDYQEKYFPVRPAEFFCLELNGEAGELANLEKKIWKGKTIDPSFIEEESADVLIALMNYSNARGINLGEAVKHKIYKIDRKRDDLNKKGENY